MFSDARCIALSMRYTCPTFTAMMLISQSACLVTCSGKFFHIKLKSRFMKRLTHFFLISQYSIFDMHTPIKL